MIKAVLEQAVANLGEQIRIDALGVPDAANGVTVVDPIQPHNQTCSTKTIMIF
jgi:hypothetical protein